MKTSIIKMSAFTDYTLLVTEASKVDGDVTLSKGRYSVDAKSLPGVFSLDLSEGAKIEYPEDAFEFDQFLFKYKIKVEG